MLQVISLEVLSLKQGWEWKISIFPENSVGIEVVSATGDFSWVQWTPPSPLMTSRVKAPESWSYTALWHGLNRVCDFINTAWA